MPDGQAPKYLVPALERGLELLLAFGQQQQELTFAEIHRLVQIPKATAYRTVQTLEYMGFIIRNPRTNTFSLGSKVLSLGFEYIASLDVAQAGQAVIEELHDRTQCNSHLAIRDETEVIYIARVSGPRSKINHVTVGTRLPAHRTSLGRMLLSGTTRGEFEKLYPNEMLTDDALGVPKTREELWNMVQQDKKRGYVIGESFFRYGISSIVYPIFNYDQQVEAVVSIMVPSKEIPRVDRDRLQKEVCAAANKISNLLGAASLSANQ